MRRAAGQCHRIDGEWVPGEGPVFSSRDPFSGEEVWTGCEATPAEVDRAVASARRASDAWAAAPFSLRADLLRAYAAAVEEDRTELARTISRETGKPLWESLAEADSVAAKVALTLEAWDQRCRREPLDLGGAAGRVLCRPLGVTAVLGPFNMPGHLPSGHLVPALLAGNTAVLKPSELAPAVGSCLVDLWEAAGLPAGVLNLVQGGGETGAALATHPDVDGVFFTGSHRTGSAIHKALAGRPEVLLALEMGGNNPLVVWGASDLEAAAVAAILSAYLTSGQRCTCARRLVLGPGTDADELLERLAARTRRLRIGGSGDRPEPFLGPVISAGAADRLLEAQDELLALGAVPLLPLERSPRCRALLRPGLLDVTAVRGPSPPDEELFGPLLQVVRVPDFEAAVVEANRTSYGLSAGILTDDRVVYRAFLSRVRAGVIHRNRPTTGASGRLPFGGLGRSGNHRPAGYRAVDFCADPVAVLEAGRLALPEELPPGVG